MLEKYKFIKTFNTPITYEETYIDEVEMLLAINERINEAESMCMELNQNDSRN